MENGWLMYEMICDVCCCSLNLVSYAKTKELFAWRCMQRSCLKYKAYFSIRNNSFFQNLKTDIGTALRCLVKYSVRQPKHSIKASMDIGEATVQRIITKLIEYIPETNFRNNKLGGPGKIVQIDETMINYKCKCHRGRSSSNKTDSLCIVEVLDIITRAYAQIIPNKKSTTIIPIICEQVYPNTIIWTDEHKSYFQLNLHEFFHNYVCHKYEFVNSIRGVNTQAIESSRNKLKLEIKRKKGIKTNARKSFLKEYCFYLTTAKTSF